MGGFRLSAREVPELRAAAIALKKVDRDLRSDINKAMRQQGNDIWRSAVADHARTPMDQAILAKGARVAAGNPPQAIAASSKRAIGRTRRLVPADHWQGYEFGTDLASKSTYQRKNRTRPGTHEVKRQTTNHLPARTKKGRVLYPALADASPRIASLWVKLIVSKIMTAAEGKD